MKISRFAVRGFMVGWLFGCGPKSAVSVPETGGAAGTSTTGGPGGAAGSGDDGSVECVAPLVGEVVGWASVPALGVTSTTGGAGGEIVTVSTAVDLRTHAAGTTPKTIQVKGTLSGNVTIGSNKTIVGLCGAQIRGHIEISGSVNVILRNITVVGYAIGDCALDPTYDPTVGCSSGFDTVSIQKNAHHVWVDHCDISEGTDGNLDITNGANYVTVSWTKFHYTPRTDDVGNDSTGAFGHRYSNLVGGTDTPVTWDDANNLNVTWHHNWWADHVSQRQPRVRFGKNHLFNNLWSSSDGTYCVRAGTQAQILVEHNIFTGVSNPQEFFEGSDRTATITASNNVYDNTMGTIATGGTGTPFASPPYDYTPDANDGVQAAVQKGAGPQ